MSTLSYMVLLTADGTVPNNLNCKSAFCIIYFIFVISVDVATVCFIPDI